MPEKEKTDTMKMNYLSSEDINVCHYVVNQLPYIEIESFETGKLITVDELIEHSLNEVKIFGDDIYLKLRSLMYTVPIDRYYESFFKYTCYIAYSIDNKSNEVIPNSGIVESYLVPRHLHEFSVFHFAHEHMHALKETNYEEYKNAFVVGETIPMFLELSIFNPKEVLKKELVKERFSYLFTDIKEEFLLADELVKMGNGVNRDINSRENIYQQRSIYEYARTSVGCYLNSFYYAIILYSMYKETPKKILDLICKVLKHEMTTKEMLIQLNIYGDIKGEVFEKELGMIKKLVK